MPDMFIRSFQMFNKRHQLYQVDVRITTVKEKSKYRYDVGKRVRSHFVRCKVNSSFHDMRRSFGSNLASAGVSLYKLTAWLGDGPEVVTRSYGHLIPQDNEINKVV
jgi:hypothetical protein